MSVSSLRRAAFTLLAGNVLAQALPLLLGPWITRLYTPDDFAHFSLVWAVATNLAVVACARYDMALPLARGAASLRALLALCGRLLFAVSGVAVLLGLVLALRWPPMALLPVLVFLMGGVQLLAMLAAREQQFTWLAASRFWQWGGAALGQVAVGYWAWGAWGLLGGAAAALVLAQLCLWPVLRRQRHGWRRQSAARMKALARRHKNFPLLNTPHAFAGAAQDTLTLLLVAGFLGDAQAGLWALALRYLKAPATLVGSAVSTALYPQLTRAPSFHEARHQVRRTVRTLLMAAVPLAVALLLSGPALFAWAFGEPWREAGELARALAPYLALHFVASPLAVVTLAWNAQAWALRLALLGQVLFLLALALGLAVGGLRAAGWAVSVAMLGYFGFYLTALWRWRA